MIGAVVAGLGKAGSQDHRIVHVRRRKIGHRLIDRGHRHHQQREIDRRADRDARCRGTAAVHRAAAAADQMHLAGIFAVDQVVERVLRPARTVGGADQRDRARPQHGGQVASGGHHDVAFPIRSRSSGIASAAKRAICSSRCSYGPSRSSITCRTPAAWNSRMRSTTCSGCPSAQ